VSGQLQTPAPYTRWVGCRSSLLAAEKKVMPMICQEQRGTKILFNSEALWFNIGAEQKMRTGMVYRLASVVTDIVHIVIWSHSVIQQFTKDTFSLLIDVFAPNT
jgi:hypothetical protein